MTFAQIAKEAILQLKGLRFHIFSIVQLEEFESGGACCSDRKALAEKYSLAYDNFTRTLKEMIADGWIIEGADGLHTRKFEDQTAKIAVEREKLEKAYLDARVNYLVALAEYNADNSQENILNQARRLEKFADAERLLNEFYRQHNLEETAKNAVLQDQAAKIAAHHQAEQNPTAKIADDAPTTAKIAVAAAGQTAKIADTNCENRRNTDCKKDLEFLNNSQDTENERSRAREPVLIFEVESAVFEIGMKERLKTPRRLPSKDWLDVFTKTYFENGYDAQYFLDTFDVLEQLRAGHNFGRRKLGWFITPTVMKNNVGKLEQLRAEVEESQKDEEKDDGSNNGKSIAGFSGKTTSVSKTKSREKRVFEKPEF